MYQLLQYLGIDIVKIQISKDFSDLSGKDDVIKRKMLNPFKSDSDENSETW